MADAVAAGLGAIGQALSQSTDRLSDLERQQHAANTAADPVAAWAAAGSQIAALRQGSYAAVRVGIAELHRVGGLLLVTRVGEWQLGKLRGEITGEQSEAGLAALQGWSERLFGCLSEAHTQLARLRTEPADQPFTELANQLGQLTNEVVAAACLFKTQPPGVLKTKVNCQVEVTCLGAASLGLATRPPTVTLCLVNEAQARAAVDAIAQHGHAAADAAIGEPCGELANGTQTMLFEQISNSFVASFRELKLKKVTRDEVMLKKAGFAATDEKFAIAFHTVLKCGEVDVTVVKLSEPIVTIVHHTQLPTARATQFWDASFSNPTRAPWAVPPAVPWTAMAPALATAFGRLTGQHQLDGDALGYLSSKLCLASQDVAWHSFAKAAMQDRSFTFWDWFHSAAHLVQAHMADLWSDNLVAGFVNKVQVEHALLTQRDGTFLLRFSDSTVGGVTVSWVGTDALGLRQVWNLEPWAAKDFAIRSLPDRLSDLEQLQFIYPDVPKRAALGKYCSLSTTLGGLSADYVPSDIAVSVGAVPGSWGQASTALSATQSSNAMPGYPDLDLESMLPDLGDAIGDGGTEGPASAMPLHFSLPSVP